MHTKPSLSICTCRVSFFSFLALQPLLPLILSPRLYPLQNPLTIRLDILHCLTLQFHHHLLIKSLSRFFEQHAKDLRIEILLHFSFGIVSVPLLAYISSNNPNPGVAREKSPIPHPTNCNPPEDRIKTTHLATNRSHITSVLPHLNTTTRSTHLLENTSHACHSINQPPPSSSPPPPPSHLSTSSPTTSPSTIQLCSSASQPS